MRDHTYHYTVDIDRKLSQQDAIDWLKTFTNAPDEDIAAATARFGTTKQAKLTTVGDFPGDEMTFIIREDGFSVDFTTNLIHAGHIYDHYDHYAMQLNAEDGTPLRVVLGELYQDGVLQDFNQPGPVAEAVTWLERGLLELDIVGGKPVLRYGPRIVYTGE